MQEWLETGMQQVNALLGSDGDFQELTQRLTAAGELYRALLRTLSPQDREVIETYLALCEEAEYQKTVAAYYCGKRNG